MEPWKLKWTVNEIQIRNSESFPLKKTLLILKNLLMKKNCTHLGLRYIIDSCIRINEDEDTKKAALHSGQATPLQPLFGPIRLEDFFLVTIWALWYLMSPVHHWHRFTTTPTSHNTNTNVFHNWISLKHCPLMNVILYYNSTLAFAIKHLKLFL